MNESKITDAIRNVVLVTGCNFGFLNHLHNFKCFVDRLGLKFLVLSLDRKTYDYITTYTNMTTFLFAGDFDVAEVTNPFWRKNIFLILYCIRGQQNFDRKISM